ncbi:F-box only protein 5 [Brienomyrus brachyistius]|uniref:F-box only protein 5 n=1 Tax=Brienomyrus brachyistius TaxID=42636 RepID=UPI0020B39EA4|nr:F-box only protein 5 [Brienomyrus brachyistius]XP_048865107.1 F-box only protein 5 [Brienomyrus brachyistius]XP_048865108.1 F-box only protein 5 [Brienomyrus brachyistius]
MKCDTENGGLSKEKTSPWKNVESVSLKPQCSPCAKAIDFNLDDVKPSSNKENQDCFSSGLHDGGLFDNESINVQEDSGYLSLHNSHIEHEEQDSVAADPCGQLQDGEESVSVQAAAYPCETRQSHPNLPQLQFQHAVCKHLAESYKKTKRYDLIAVRSLVKGSGLQNVIGRKMGLDHVDILQMLWEKDMKHILTKILRLLGDADLIYCKRVSRSWQKIVLQDIRARKRCQAAERPFWESRKPSPFSTRDLAASRVVLSCIQDLASTPKPNKNCSRQTRSIEYQEVASTLKQHECLKACKRCGSPAKCNLAALRATCTRASCGFDFCTLCLCDYHGSSPCPLRTPGSVGHSRSSPVIGGSRSKRNVRRL